MYPLRLWVLLESVSRAKLHIVSDCVGPSASKEEEREEEGKEITEENREKKRTDERKDGGSDEARVNRVQSRERKGKGKRRRSEESRRACFANVLCGVNDDE